MTNLKAQLFFAALVLASGISLAQDLKTGLRVCMPLGINADDFSGNQLHGTISGGVVPAPDRFSNPHGASYFPADTNDYIKISNFNNVISGHEFCISMWARAEHNTSNCLFLLDADDATDRCTGCAMYKNAGVIWDYGDIFNKGRLMTHSQYDNIWHHYAFVVSMNGNRKEIYVDGVNVASAASFGLLHNRFRDLLIGSGTSDIGGGSIRWRGWIDDVMIYDRALTAADIHKLSKTPRDCSFVSDPPLPNGIAQLTNAYIRMIPAGHGFYHFSSPGVTLREVLSVDGRNVYKGMDLPPGQNIDLSGLQDGIYFLRIETGVGLVTSKLVHTRN